MNFRRFINTIGPALEDAEKIKEFKSAFELFRTDQNNEVCT